MRVLVVDDDPALLANVREWLAVAGVNVDVAGDAPGGLAAASSGFFDAVVLDVMLGGDCDGVEVCRLLRRAGVGTPVLMLSARDAVPDRVRGLEAGADDYISKPFAWPELLARIRALVRRTVTQSGALVMRIDNLELDETSHTVHRGARAIELTRLEFRLLRYLMRNAGRIVTIKMIAAAVWEQTFTDHSRTYQNSLAALRRKIEGEDPSLPGGQRRLLHTIPGRGYILDPDYKP